MSTKPLQVNEASAAYVAQASENVPPGYKKTEVGVIPEEWEVKTISEVANVKTGPFGSALHERDYVQEGTPIITVEHLGEHGVVHENLPLVSDLDRARLKSYSLRENDIVFSRVGSVDRNSLVSKTEDGWLFSGRLLRVRVSDGSVYPPYLSYHFHSEPFKQRVREVAVGQTMASLNTQILKGLRVVLPTFIEQRAIAEALSDVDGLLAALDKLIAKKRAIKQAAVQQLLTGKTRLPGFSGRWETKRLGEIADLHRENIVPAHFGNKLFTHFSLPAFDEGRTPVIEPGTSIGSNKFKMPANAILVSKLNPRIPRVWLPDDGASNAVASTEFLVLTPKQGMSRQFLYNVCSSPKFCEQLELSTTGTTGSHQRITPSDALKVTVHIPVDTEEQSAIAIVLADMDAEIAALEARREKAKQIKQGMMQQLLTGRVRLV
jgi:type I restriction enzyme S subunit